MRFDGLKAVGHRGWYIVASPLESELNDSGNIHAWCKGRRDEPQTFPHVIHVPYTSHRHNDCLHIQSYTEFLEGQVQHLDSLRTVLGQLMVSCVADDEVGKQNQIDAAMEMDEGLREFSGIGAAAR